MKIHQITDKLQLRLTESVFKGKDRIDIRKYYYTGEHYDPATGEGDTYSPTTKGISLAREEAHIVLAWLMETLHDPAKG